MHRRITVTNFVKIGRCFAEILRFFKFSRWPTPPSWIFEIAKFYWPLGSRGSRRISMPNFVKIGQSVAKKIFPFFDFRNREFLFAVAIWRAQAHHCTKFRQNWSFRCGDIAIFRIFKMAAVHHIGLVWGIFGPPTVSTCGSLSLCKIWV